MSYHDDLPVPFGYEVPQFVKQLLENFDVCLFQMRLDPDPDAHLSIIRNLYVHDLIVSAIVALNMPKEKEALVKELSQQLEILSALTNPIEEDLKN
jgi:hypothetical protein